MTARSDGRARLNGSCAVLHDVPRLAQRMDARGRNQGLPVTLTGWLLVIDLILAFGVVAFLVVLMVMRR